MRVTRETLIRLAKENARTRAFDNKDIVAAYLIGSLLGDDPFIGGLTDIDLVFVTAGKPPRSREIVKLTGDFHLDITYHARAEYNPARELRVNPWLGTEIYNPMLLYEREKFFDFVQAAVRAGFEFNAPTLTLQRCRTLLAHGRGIWTDLLETGETVGPKDVAHYLKAIYHAGLRGGGTERESPCRAETSARLSDARRTGESSANGSGSHGTFRRLPS